MTRIRFEPWLPSFPEIVLGFECVRAGCEHAFVLWEARRQEVEAAVAASQTKTETLRRLGLRAAGANFRMLDRCVERWGLDTDHWTPFHRIQPARYATPLEDVLVEGSTYSRAKLKKRLYAAGLKERRCELCGQGEVWRGKRISLILDHVNGIHDDNRLENLRIVCPNCAAGLETHCGRNTRRRREPRECALCGVSFEPRKDDQRYCSRDCGTRRPRGDNAHLRRVERPPEPQLLAEIEALGYSGVGRRYGVSDNAIRKWVRQYERERERGGGADGGPELGEAA